MTAPGQGGGPDAPRPADDQPDVDYHPADLTADQRAYVDRERADRTAAEQSAPAEQPGGEPVPGATADSAPPPDDAQPTPDGDGGAGETGTSGSSGSDPVAAAQAKVDELTDVVRRTQAEFVNYKRRVERDRDLVKQNATFAALTSLLPVMDDIDRAREHGEVEGGFKAVADSLDRAVASLGLVKFGEAGEEFDPTVHEALMHGSSDEVTTTVVDKVVQAGFRIGDRVVRAAKVTVVGPEA